MLDLLVHGGMLVAYTRAPPGFLLVPGWLVAARLGTPCLPACGCPAPRHLALVAAHSGHAGAHVLSLTYAPTRSLALPHPPCAVYLAIWFTWPDLCYMGGCTLSGWGIDYQYISLDVQEQMGKDASDTGNAFDYWSWGIWTSEMKVGCAWLAWTPNPGATACVAAGSVSLQGRA